MRRLIPGRGPSSRPGQLYAVEETPSQKLDSLSRNRRLSRVSSIPARQFQAGCPIEKPIPKTKTKKNEPTRRRIYNRTTPGEKGGLGWALWSGSVAVMLTLAVGVMTVMAVMRRSRVVGLRL